MARYGNLRREQAPARVVGIALLGSVVGLAEAGMLLAVVAVASRSGGAQAPTVAGQALPQSTGTLVGTAVVLALLVGVGQYAATRVTVDLARTEVVRVRSRVLRGFARAEWEHQTAEPPGAVLSLTTTTADQVAVGALQRTGALVALGRLIVLLLAALAVSPGIALSVGLVGAAGLLVSRALRSRTRRAVDRSARSGLALADTITEMVWLSRELRTFAVTESYLSRLDEAVAAAARSAALVQVRTQVAPQTVRTLMTAVLAVGLGVLSTVDLVPLPVLAACAVLLLRAVGYGQALLTAGTGLAVRSSHLRVIEQALRRWEPQAGTPAPAGVSLALDGVTYRYELAATTALDGVCLKLTRGELVGLTGVSGSGKSTLVSLLAGLLRPTSGAVRVDGVAVEQPPRVALVPQEPRLLTGTVADNIRFLRSDLSDEQIHAAAAAAGLLPDIEGWPAGLDHDVGVLGRCLSGGQAQRVAVARALAGHPALLVLDEPTSALDVATEGAVLQALRRATSTACVLVVSHRSSTLRHCDRVVVLQDGRLQETLPAGPA